MQLKTEFQIILSLYLWAPVYVPVARNHEEMVVSPKVNFLILQLFSFVEDYLSFVEARYDTYVFLSSLKILLCLQTMSI